MEYKLDKDQSLLENVHTIFTDEISGSIDALENLDVHEAIHDVRKRMKKLRALARLFRDELGEKAYKAFNKSFRDLSRDISEFRDLTAHLETLENLRKRYGKYLYKNFFNSVENNLKKERQEMTEKLIEENFFSGHLLTSLKNIQEDLKKWPVNSNNIKIVLPGIKRVYKRGKKSMDLAYKNQNPENFHEWRKRVKYLWYQILLLQDIWPQFFESLEVEVHLLADYLGDDHDLVLFKQKILSEDFELLDTEQREMYEALIAEFSDNLRENARTKGELIYAESPADFKKRIAKYTEANWN